MAVLTPPAALVLGTGQIGTFAARALAARGGLVTTADRDPASTLMSAYGPPRASRCTVDARSDLQVRSLLASVHPDVVVIATRDASAHSAPFAAIARAASDAGVRRLVLVSSLAVYHPSPTERVAESHPVRPTSEYGRAKLAAEDAVTRHAGDVEVVVLRSTGVYGPPRPGHASRSSRLVAGLLAAARHGRTLQVRAPVGSCDEYLYVKDLSAAIALTALAVPVKGVEVFNVGPGCTNTVSEVVAAICSVVPGARLDYADSRGPAVAARQPLDTTRLAHAGFVPRYDLRAGIADLQLGMAS